MELPKTSNIQHRTSNIERENTRTATGAGRKYDLEERLLEYAVQVIGVAESLPNTRTGNHIASQLLRSGTSPLPNHGEAQAAESPADFVHKLQICLKELRETRRWLLLVQRASLVKNSAQVQHLTGESEEHIRIFVASIRTSKERSPSRNRPMAVSKLDVRC